MTLYDFLISPYGLPVHPALEHALLGAISTIATLVATSLSRGVIHELRGKAKLVLGTVIYIVLWLLLCLMLLIETFITTYWIPIMIVLGAIAFLEICVLIILSIRRKQRKTN